MLRVRQAGRQLAVVLAAPCRIFKSQVLCSMICSTAGGVPCPLEYSTREGGFTLSV